MRPDRFWSILCATTLTGCFQPLQVSKGSVSAIDGSGVQLATDISGDKATATVDPNLNTNQIKLKKFQVRSHVRTGNRGLPASQRCRNIIA